MDNFNPLDLDSSNLDRLDRIGYLDSLDEPRSGSTSDYYCPNCQFYFLDQMYYSGDYSCPVCSCTFDKFTIENAYNGQSNIDRS